MIIPASVKPSVRVMRVLCPIFVATSLAGTIVSYATKNYCAVPIDAFCMGVNATLTWVQWYIFEI